MSTAFEELLELLQDADQAFPVGRLSELSDPDKQQMQQFERIWSLVPLDRRRILLQELGQLADLHIEYSFERINRLALADTDEVVRSKGIRNLWECEDPSLVPDLVSAIYEDQSAEVRGAAASALGHFVYMGEVDQIIPDLLCESEDALLHATKEDPNPAVRLTALESLGYSSRDEVEALINAAFDSSDTTQRRAALVAMGRSANRIWKDAVLSQLNHPEPTLREEAIKAAGELELREAVPSVIEQTDDVNDLVRLAAIWALGQLGGEDARSALTSLLEYTEDAEEVALIEDALDLLTFVDRSKDLLLFDFDEPSLSD